MPQRIRRLSIESFLESQGTGKVDLEQSLARLRALCEAWSTDPSQNVLVDVRKRTFDLSHSDLKEFMLELKKTGLGLDNKVAFVYRHREPLDAPVFASFLAEGLGVKVKAFDDYEDALDWLAASDMPIAHLEND